MRGLLLPTLAAALCGYSFVVSAQGTASVQPQTWQDVHLTKDDYPKNFDVLGPFRIRTNFVSYKVLEVENWGANDYGCIIAVVGSQGDPPMIKGDYFFNGMKGYSNNDSNRTYGLNQYFVIDGEFSFPTNSDGSRRTIPRWRYATDEEKVTIHQRIEDLKKEKFNRIVNHIYYINEAQAAYFVTNNVKLPNGWRYYVVNAAGTNFFDINTYGKTHTVGAPVTDP